jgi:site-specific DNA recombinase
MARRRNLQPVPDNAGRVVLYVRVSALMGREEERLHSPDVQVEGMRRMISRAGLREVDVIDDDIDRSGRTFDRPGIARIRAMVEAKRVDVIAVNDLSRVGRNLTESLTFLRWLQERGVSVMSANQPVDDTPEGRFMLGFWLNHAELLSNQIGAGWSRVIERRARMGLAHARTAQGYVKVDGRLEVDPVLGPAFILAARAYARGDPIVDVAFAYGAARGWPISRPNLKSMLRNPLYRGRVVVHITGVGKIDAEGLHPALIDDETWVQIERRMAAESSMPTRYVEPQYSLTGLLKCAHCGNNLQIWHDGKPRPSRRVTCPRRREFGDCPGIGTPLYDGIEEAVLAEIGEYAGRLRGDPTARAQQRERVTQAGADLPTLERELKATRAAQTRLTTRYAKGGLPEAAYDATLAELVATERAQQAQLDRARDVSTAPTPSKVVKLVDRMMELWPEMTGTERNRALKSILVSATVRRADRWREPEVDRVSDYKFRW